MKEIDKLEVGGGVGIVGSTANASQAGCRVNTKAISVDGI